MAENRYLVQLGVPDVEDCSTDYIPEDVLKGKKEVVVPVLKTMTKYLFDNYRLPMYSYVNHLLRTGKLQGIVGVKPKNRIFNKQSCWFPGVKFWRIDRNSCYADVSVTLRLETDSGEVEWKGCLVHWCSFKGPFTCNIEELTKDPGHEESFIKLDPCLVPICTNKKMDELTEDIWNQFIPAALTDKKMRNAKALAEKMGLSIQYQDIYEHRNTVDSMIFFAEGDLEVGKDRTTKDEYGEKYTEKDETPKIVHIPANTIVINTNRIDKDYSDFSIFHECIHYEFHYMFFRLQEMASNDPRKVEVEKKLIDADREYKDPIYFMEKQANRGAYGLLLPATHTEMKIGEERAKVMKFAHAGELYETVGKAMSREFSLPYFRIRPRMIQLGHFAAKGSLNFANRVMIPPFAFDADALQDECLTLVVERYEVYKLCEEVPLLKGVMDTMKYVYADGHVVKNDPRFVKKDTMGLGYKLTPWANAHADKCCLRFIRKYIQESVGKYVFGRMCLDTDYIERTNVFLQDLMMKEGVDEIDAESRYLSKLPRNFKKAVEELRKPENVSIAKLAECLNMDDRTLSRWLEDPSKYRNEDFLTMVCLTLKLPDWLSKALFRRAGMMLDEEDRRHNALLHILRVQSCEGIDEANKTLKRYNMSPLTLG